MGGGEQAGLERGRALGERAVEVERAEHAVRGRADRQLDERADQQRREPAHRGRLGRAALAAHEHAADRRVDRARQQRLAQVLLADERARTGTAVTPPGLLELALDVEVRVAQRVERAGRGAAHSPRSAASSRRSAIARSAHGFERVQEVAHLVRAHVALGHRLVHPVLDDAGRGVVAEQVVDGGRQLERALVAVAHHRGDPARVRDARSGTRAAPPRPASARRACAGSVESPITARGSAPARWRT